MADANKCPEPCGGSAAVLTCPGMSEIISGGALVLEPPKGTPRNVYDLAYTFTWDVRIVSTDDSKYSPTFEVRVTPRCLARSMWRAADAWHVHQQVKIVDDTNYELFKQGSDYAACSALKYGDALTL